ncbi:MAG: glycosyltransferase [Spirochaetes bacterium]|nr:glycosyltransferase [Spirochaetota bacterium]
MNNTIALISSVHYWDDTRILFKEALSLNEYFPVEIHALSDFKYKEKNKIKIYGLKIFKSRLLRPINWFVLLKRILKKQIKVIIFHDPELIIIGLFLKIFTTKIVSYDIREDYGKTIIDKKWIPFNFLRKVISKIFIDFENFATRFFDINILVLDKWKDKYKNSVIVKNYPVSENNINLTVKKRGKYIVYIGTLNDKRGIIQMLKAFNLASEKKKNIKLLLIGEWTDEKTKKEALKLIDNKNIKLTGYLNITEAKEIMKKARAGFCLYTMKQYEENIPVKMYEYLMLGTPVIYSNFNSWVNIIKKEGWGISADPHSIKDISQVILKIFDDKIFTRLNKACRKCKNYYSWDNEVIKLINKIKECIKTK